MPYSVDAPGVDAPGLSSFAKESLPDFNNPISNAALGISAYNIARNLGVGLPSLGIPGMAINAALNAALQAERDRDVLGYTKTTIPGQIARSIIPGPLQRGILGQLGQLGPYQQAVYDKAPLSQLQDAAKQTQYQHMYTPEEQSLMSKSELDWDYDIADPDPSLSVAGVEGVKGVTMDSDELGLDNWSGPTTVDSETSYGYGVQDETDAEEGQAAADAQEDMDYDEDYGWNEGGLARKFGAPDTQGINLGGYTERNPAAGVSTSNFSVRTPPQGIPLGDVANVTGAFNRSTSEATPGALGIPQEAIDNFRLQNQKRKESSYNAGISVFFPPGRIPDFVAKVLLPKSATASYGRSQSTSTDVRGNEVENSNISRGIGAKGQVLRGMFGDNAPTFGVQYDEPNRYDRSFSGSVNIPVGSGNVSLYGSQNWNKGRSDDTTVGVRGKLIF